MKSPIVELFGDKRIVDKIKRRLPYMFQLAEMESTRAGKTGMEVGSTREKIIIALLICRVRNSLVGTVHEPPNYFARQFVNCPYIQFLTQRR
ncbi:MAG: ThaI family type II restriction endonuclease [Aquificaceae bacterium]